MYIYSRIEIVHRQYQMRFPLMASELVRHDTGQAALVVDDSDDDIYAPSAAKVQPNLFKFTSNDRSLDYFSRMRADRYTDPMAIWDNELRLVYPSLARMAYDCISIPASSTSVERLFSAGGLIVTKKRNRLEPERIQKLMCINKWLPDFGRGVVGSYIEY